MRSDPRGAVLSSCRHAIPQYCGNHAGQPSRVNNIHARCRRLLNDDDRLEPGQSAQGGVFGRPDTEAARRSSELAGHPRPLTDDESTELRATLAAVPADLRATGAILPDIREEAHDRSGRSSSSVPPDARRPGPSAPGIPEPGAGSFPIARRHRHWRQRGGSAVAARWQRRWQRRWLGGEKMRM
jgi:hypothetical protein